MLNNIGAMGAGGEYGSKWDNLNVLG